MTYWNRSLDQIQGISLFFSSVKPFCPWEIQKLSDLTVHRKGRTATLKCELNVASAKQEWFHNGRRIVPCRDYKISRGMDKKNKRTQGMLTIDYVTQENIGVYTCVATNSAGFVSTSCYLTIRRGMLKAIESVFAQFSWTLNEA